MRVATSIVIAVCLTITGCCRRQYCEGLRQWRAQVAVGYEDCCRKPTETERQACISKFGQTMQGALALDSGVKAACEEGNAAEARAQVKQIQALFPARIVTVPAPAAEPGKLTGEPKVVNTWVVFGVRDWIEAGAKGVGVNLSLPDGAEAKPASDAGAKGGEGTFAFVDGSVLDVRFGADPAMPIALSGKLTLADMHTTTTGKSAVPAALDFTLNAVGAKLTLRLDKSSPHNRLVADAKGIGTLAFAATIDSESPGLAPCWYMGTTLYFVLPVRVSEDFRTISLTMTRKTPASEYTPVEPWVLRAADGRWKGKITNTPQADTDGDGIRDGASELIYAVWHEMADYCDEMNH